MVEQMTDNVAATTEPPPPVDPASIMAKQARNGGANGELNSEKGFWTGISKAPVVDRVWPRLFGSSLRKSGRLIDVGWLLRDEQTSLIWAAPRTFRRDDPKPTHAKAVNNCPSVLDYEARLFEVLCPFDMHLGFKVDKGRPILINRAGANSAIESSALSKMVSLQARSQWRHPNRPVLQIGTPYVFIADEPVQMMQMPAFNHYPKHPLPGLVIGGRLPIDVWPRTMSWAFEWCDPNKDLILRRGDPWFYVRFETFDPTRKVRLSEAELTPELKTFLGGMTGVTRYVRGTHSLFNVARERRPKKLLVKRRR